MFNGLHIVARMAIGGFAAPALAVITAVALLAVIAPSPAQAAEAAGAAWATDGSVSLVRSADGSLQVVRGATFAGGQVVATGPEHTYSIAGAVTDEARSMQWALDRVDAERVWDTATGDGQVIAVIDTGVDGAHPDLTRRLTGGFSAVGGDPRVDVNGHGTHVAGIAAAAADGVGVVGLAHGARIMPIQVTDANGIAYTSDVAEGVLHAVDHGADVINLSLAGPNHSPVLAAAITYANANGVAVVAAAGNEGNRDNPLMFPAADDGVIAVASVNDRDERSSFSSNGSFVDLAAPGSAIYSTRPGSYGYGSGTSMAAPFVAAAVALVASTGVSPHDAVDLLTATAVDLGDPGVDGEFGHGMVDLITALDAPEVDEAPVTPVRAALSYLPREAVR